MADAAVTYSDYLAQIREKDPAVLLGSLAWYSVPEGIAVPHDELTEWLDELGLPVQPSAPRDDDVFRRVASSYQKKMVETDDPEVFENYLIRDVVRRGGRVVKHIVVEAVDRRGETLSHEDAVKVEFEEGIVTVTPLQSPANDQAMNVGELIRLAYLRNRGTVDSYAVRELFRKTILSTGATVVRPTGGVYFVMEKHRAVTDALVALAKRIGPVSFVPVPLINDGEMQEMLREAIEAETRGEIEKTLDEIDKLMDGPDITARRYHAMFERFQQVKAKTVEYAELLDEKLAGCELLVGSYEAKMKTLFMHVDSDQL